jgi:hypothetical protein
MYAENGTLIFNMRDLYRAKQRVKQQQRQQHHRGSNNNNNNKKLGVTEGFRPQHIRKYPDFNQMTYMLDPFEKRIGGYYKTTRFGHESPADFSGRSVVTRKDCPNREPDLPMIESMADYDNHHQQQQEPARKALQMKDYVRKWPDFNELSYMNDPHEKAIGYSRGHFRKRRPINDVRFTTQENQDDIYRINPGAHDYRLDDPEVARWERYRLFPKSNVPTPKSDYDQLEHFKLYPHMYMQYSQLRNDFEKQEHENFVKPQHGAVRYPIPMYFNLRFLQRPYPKQAANGTDYEMRPRPPNRRGTYELPEGQTFYSDQDMMQTARAEFERFMDNQLRTVTDENTLPKRVQEREQRQQAELRNQRMPRVLEFQTAQGIVGQQLEAGQWKKRWPPETMPQAPKKTSDKAIRGNFARGNPEIRITDATGYTGPKFKPWQLVRFYSDRDLKGKEYVLKSGWYEFRRLDDPRTRLNFRSFLVPDGWTVKLVFLVDQGYVGLDYKGPRAVSDFTKPLDQLRGIRILPPTKK